MVVLSHSQLDRLADKALASLLSLFMHAHGTGSIPRAVLSLDWGVILCPNGIFVLPIIQLAPGG